jgi:hypothetical protein
MTIAPGSLAFSRRPIAIGHNGGPPLDLSWTAWNWRRAHAQAWKSPGREIVMMRLRRAEQLGLDYRAYTSVLLDRGARLCGLVVMMSGPLLRHTGEIAAKLAALKDCAVVLSGDDPGFEGYQRCGRDRLAQTIKTAAGSAGVSPSAFFMVSCEDGDRRLAQAIGIGLFVDAFDYFNMRRAGPETF